MDYVTWQISETAIEKPEKWNLRKLQWEALWHSGKKITTAKTLRYETRLYRLHKIYVRLVALYLSVNFLLHKMKRNYTNLRVLL